MKEPAIKVSSLSCHVSVRDWQPLIKRMGSVDTLHVFKSLLCHVKAFGQVPFPI